MGGSRKRRVSFQPLEFVAIHWIVPVSTGVERIIPLRKDSLICINTLSRYVALGRNAELTVKFNSCGVVFQPPHSINVSPLFA